MSLTLHCTPTLLIIVEITDCGMAVWKPYRLFN